MPNEEQISFAEIGARLKAHRLGKGLSPEALAEKLEMSRAALYRVEKGDIRKIETLTKTARVLGVSLASLMGVGVEYVSNAIAFFERMRQLEEGCEQIIGMFSPVSYLLTSDDYDAVLEEVLLESLPETVMPKAEAAKLVTSLLDILRARKQAFRLRRPLIVSLISAADIERFLVRGLIGRHDLAAETIRKRRLQALAEAESILSMLREEPIGIQLGIVREPGPATTFQIFRQNDRSVLAISPFRLGEQPNIRIGVAMITSASEAMQLHEDIAARLWKGADKGSEAADFLEGLINRYGV